MQPMINVLLDPVVNFGKVTVSSIGYISTDTEVTLATGDGSKLPNPLYDGGSFNLVWFNNSTYSDPADDPYVEIVRCIARVDDTLTLMRHQEGTSASDKNIPTKVYKMILSPTKKTIDDIQTESQSKVNTHSALSTGVHGVGVDTIDGASARNIAISTHSSIASNVHNFDTLGNSPAQTHGISRHTGTIGTWANIDKTTSSITDITTRSHTLLTDIGTNTHATIDAAILNSTTHIGTSIAHGVTSNIVGISDTQTLTNKTLTSPFISTIYGGNAANDDITIEGTSNATKTSSYVILQPTSGNVGIGTTNPQYGKLQVDGNVALSLGNGAWKVRLGNQNFGNSVLNVYNGDQGNAISVLDVGTNLGSALFVKYNGNVGIGTTNPGTTLELGLNTGGGFALGQGKLYLSQGGDSNHYVQYTTSGIVYYDNTAHLFQGSNVGIGTTTPSAKLHIGGTAGVDGIKFPDGTTQTTAATLIRPKTTGSFTGDGSANRAIAHGLGMVPFQVMLWDGLRTVIIRYKNAATPVCQNNHIENGGTVDTTLWNATYFYVTGATEGGNTTGQTEYWTAYA